MTNIKLVTKDTKTSGNIDITGNRDEITREIYAILDTVAEECPEEFSDALACYMHDLITKEEKI